MIIQTLNIKATMLQEKIEIAQTAMKNIQLPDGTQAKIVKYLSISQAFIDS